MSTINTRQQPRDSLFLLAHLRVDGSERSLPVKVRNLSPGGMMAEGDAEVMRGSLVSVELRNIGWVDGTVAWKQGNRFGIGFVQDVDPDRVKAPGQAKEFEPPRFARARSTDPASLRKV